MREMFDPASYAFSWFAVPVIGVGAINWLLGLGTSWRERASGPSITLLIMTLTIGVWLVGLGGANSTANPDAALAWIKISMLGTVFVPVGVFMNAAAGCERPRVLRAGVAIGGVLSSVLAALVLGTGLVLHDVHRYFWGFYPIYGAAGPLLIGYYAVSFVAGGALYRFGQRTTRSAIQRNRMKIRLAALLMAIPATIDFLPTMHIGVYPFGYLFILGYSALATYSIWRYRLVDITPALAARQIIGTMAEGLVVIDRDGIVRLVNDAAADLFGTTRKSLLGSHAGAIDRVCIDVTLASLVPEDEVGRCEISLRAADGSDAAAIVSVSRLRDARGEWLGTVYVFHDITDRRRAEERIRYLAFHDALTGAANRSVLMDRLAQAIARARRDGSAVGLIFVDLDGFKRVNDAQGHDAGDELLSCAASSMQDLLRECDTLARLGGDEFVVLLPDISHPADAIRVAERILGQLGQERHGGLQAPIAASLGIATYPGDCTSAESLLRCADAAMYRAKNRGGNRLELATPSDPNTHAA